MLHAERSQIGSLLFCARGGKYLATCLLDNLNRSQSYTPCCPMYQYPLSCLNMSEFIQSVVRGQKDAEYPGCCLHAHLSRFTHNISFIHYQPIAETVRTNGDHFITQLEAVDA